MPFHFYFKNADQIASLFQGKDKKAIRDVVFLVEKLLHSVTNHHPERFDFDLYVKIFITSVILGYAECRTMSVNMLKQFLHELHIVSTKRPLPITLGRSRQDMTVINPHNHYGEFLALQRENS